MDYMDYLYTKYLEDLEKGDTNLTFDEYVYYCENNVDGICTL